jgi:hypothetical protein
MYSSIFAFKGPWMIAVATRLLFLAMYAACTLGSARSQERFFLSNLGRDVGGTAEFNYEKIRPGTAFDDFYAALKTWGKDGRCAVDDNDFARAYWAQPK